MIYFYKPWMKLAEGLGFINTRIILFIVFYGMFMPMGLVMRLAGKDFMVFGELLDEVRPQSPVPVLTTVWNRTSRHSASLPAVQGTLWRARDGRLAVFLVNYGDRPQAITTTWLPAPGGPFPRKAGWCSG